MGVAEALATLSDHSNNSWYPGGQPTPPADRLFLSRDYVSMPTVLEQLRHTLPSCAAGRVWELPQDPFQPAREMDLELFNPACPLGLDVYWASKAGTHEVGGDWLIFGSHEELTTLAGDELVAEFKRRVPEWQAGEWRPPWSV